MERENRIIYSFPSFHETQVKENRTNNDTKYTSGAYTFYFVFNLKSKTPNLLIY